MRQELMNRVRAEIEAGTYETDARLNAAADRLLADLMGDGSHLLTAADETAETPRYFAGDESDQT